jgi:hypothetical protein
LSSKAKVHFFTHTKAMYFIVEMLLHLPLLK